MPGLVHCSGDSSSVSNIPHPTKSLSNCLYTYTSPPPLEATIALPSLGSLATLPTELLFEILSHLDLATLRDLTAVSAQSRALISSLSFYQFLLKECSSLVKTILATGVSAHFSLSKLRKLLTTRSCAFCGNHGTLLLLVRAERCCEGCILNGKEAAVVNAAWISARYGLSSEDLATLPQVHAQPGTYSAQGRQQFILSKRASSPLVSLQLAHQLFSSRAHTPSSELPDAHLALLPNFPEPQPEHGFLPAPGLYPSPGSSACLRVLKLLSPAYTNMCVTSLPWVKERSQNGRRWGIEEPLTCEACTPHRAVPGRDVGLRAGTLAARRGVGRVPAVVYTAEELNIHLLECNGKLRSRRDGFVGMNVPSKLLAV